MAPSFCLHAGAGLRTLVKSGNVTEQSPACRYSSTNGLCLRRGRQNVSNTVGVGSHVITRHGRRPLRTTALLNEGEGQGGEDPKKKKGIKRDDEPEQYWRSEAERSGKSPMASILPWVAILGLLLPFAILGIAFANGYIKMPSGY